jgi:flagellar hook-associated protein 1
MTGLTQVLNISISAIEAATEGMQTVSNNTANVNTPGYNMETINQVSVNGADIPAGGLGAGVDVTSIQRAFNQFVYQEILGATATNQSASTIYSNIQNLSGMFPVASGGENGLGQAISAFFGGANTVAQDPSNIPDRQVMLGDAQSVASLFNSVGTTLASDLTTQNQQIGSMVNQINTLTGQIASLNTTIEAEEGSTGGTAPNSLLDQRDQAVEQLSQLIGVNVVTAANGSENIYAAGGATLVAGNTSFALQATSGSYSDGNTSVVYGPTGEDITASISGGQLGGLIAFRAQLTNVANSVGALAASFATAINDQQAQGVDLNGNLGTAMFNVPGPTVYSSSANTGSGSLSAAITDMSTLVPDNFIVTKTATGFQATDLATGQVTSLGSGSTFSYHGMTLTVSGSVNTGDSFEVEPTVTAAQDISVAISDPNLIAAASPYVATAGALTSAGSIVDNNAGNVQATIGSTVKNSSLSGGTVVVPPSDFGQQLTIQFTSATAFSVLNSSGTTIASGSFSPTSGATIALEYPAGAASGEAVTVSLSPGSAAAGDDFVLSLAGSGDNGNISAMAAINGENVISGESLTDYYAQLVSSIGNQGQEAAVASQASQSVLTSAQNTQQSISGVNLDEQATLLVSYQQAYQAASQIISTTETLFSGLITAMQDS